jgi:hypothetical protein
VAPRARLANRAVKVRGVRRHNSIVEPGFDKLKNETTVASVLRQLFCEEFLFRIGGIDFHLQSRRRFFALCERKHREKGQEYDI